MRFYFLLFILSAVIYESQSSLITKVMMHFRHKLKEQLKNRILVRKLEKAKQNDLNQDEYKPWPKQVQEKFTPSSVLVTHSCKDENFCKTWPEIKDVAYCHLKHTKDVQDVNSVYYVHTMRKTTSDDDIANFLFVELPAEGRLVEENTKPIFITMCVHVNTWLRSYWSIDCPFDTCEDILNHEKDQPCKVQYDYGVSTVKWETKVPSDDIIHKPITERFKQFDKSDQQWILSLMDPSKRIFPILE